MSDTRTTAVLNLGSQRVSLARFDVSKTGGLVLKGYQADEVSSDPLFDAARENQIRAILSDLVGGLSLDKSKTRFSLPSQSIFIRFVKLPPIGGDNLDQLVTFEAQQHVPFPLDEVTWDYEIIEGAVDKEVVIVAIKSDALEEVNKTVQDSGLITSAVDVAPMALYNSFIASYGEPEETTLLIDVGARTSDLLFMQGSKFFTRSVALGGASVTAAIAKEFGVSFTEAEQQKCVNGLVSLGGGHTSDLSENKAALAMCIRNAMTRLPAEITRTTNYYRSQHGGQAPQKVYLAGGGANLPYTLEFFKEKLNLPVEFFNPLQNVTVSKDLDTEKIASEAHMMGELVGLGLRATGSSSVNVDLVPQALGVTRAAEKRMPFLVAAMLLLVLGTALWACLSYVSANKAEDQLRTNLEIRDNLKPVGKKIKTLLRKEKKLSNLAEKYIQVEKEHALWFDILAEVNGTFSSDSMWITELVPMYGFKPFGNSEDAKGAQMEIAVNDPSGRVDQTASVVLDPPKANNPVNGKKKRPRLRKPKPKIDNTMVHSIILTGFWRENLKSQDIVSNALSKLRTNSQYFSFEPLAGGQPFSDEQLLKVSMSGDKDDLGYPFTVVLPLKSPISPK